MGKSMDCKFLLICDYASVTVEGKPNILGIFGELRPPALPWMVPVMFVVAQFEAHAPEFDQPRVVKVEIINSDATETVWRGEQTITVPRSPLSGIPATLNYILGISSVTFATADDYAVHISVNGDTKGSALLRVNPAPAPGGL
jgi:hypothetical protein